MCCCQDQHLHSFFTHCQRLENFTVAGTDSDMLTSRQKVDYVVAHCGYSSSALLQNYLFEFILVS